jgi:hypothetical protein
MIDGRLLPWFFAIAGAIGVNRISSPAMAAASLERRDVIVFDIGYLCFRAVRHRRDRLSSG